MSVELHVGQLLRCAKEHFGLGPGGIWAMNVDDLIVVVEVTSHCQGRGVRLDDGVEISLLTLDTPIYDDAECFVGMAPSTYEVLR
jgi:hypothetical protein